MTLKNSINLVVADTSPLIAIAIMELFPVLNELFEQVIVPRAVVHECLYDLIKSSSIPFSMLVMNKLITVLGVHNISSLNTPDHAI